MYTTWRVCRLLMTGSGRSENEDRSHQTCVHCGTQDCIFSEEAYKIQFQFARISYMRPFLLKLLHILLAGQIS